MSFENPFTPSFGEIPVHLAGRSQIIQLMERAYRGDRRRPEHTLLLKGARGTGKTTLLSVLAHKAEANGWIAVNATALPGMLDDIEIGAKRAAGHLLNCEDGRKIAGISIAQVGGVSFQQNKELQTNWRYRMTDLLDKLAEHQVGLLVSVDELDPNLDEVVELVAVYQHFIREERKIALLMAGLPHNVSALLGNKTVSFLRRAQQETLGRIPDNEVRIALRKTIVDYGRTIDEEALSIAVSGIDGFPFLMQLVGYRAWDIDPEKVEISADDMRAGIDLARGEMESRILESTYRDLSDGDITFLEAMLKDEGDSRIADIGRRLSWSSAQVAQYRRRMIDAGVIGERRRGVVGFDLPYMREYLQER